MNSLVAASGIKKYYMNGRKEVRAVDDVTIAIEKGVSTAITGPSGAGKSTLLHILGGLDRPTSGQVMIDGIDIYRLGDRERSRIRNARVGFVFQFYHLLPEFSSLENVMMPGMIKRRVTKESAMRSLSAVGLSDRAHHRPGELSGGEAQRVAIARALINEPEILLCDEPTGNLDSNTSRSIYELLLDLKAKTGLTLVIVTHDENLSARMDRVIRLKDGKLSQ